jgi:hypothetical protein
MVDLAKATLAYALRTDFTMVTKKASIEIRFHFRGRGNVAK